MNDTKTVEHGIRGACYSNSPSGFHPILFCLCNWETSHAYNWEEAGQQMDEHLKNEFIAKTN